MQKTIIIIGAAFLLAFCHTKKKAVESPAPAVVTVAPKSALEIAQKRWPNTNSDELAQGKTIYETKCTKCHGEKKIVTRSEKSWLHEIDDMSPKAHLTPEEKEKLTRYILSYREANTSTN
jgi:mono/diheme cytochrome c family protein